jgi:nucleoside-diphosphate kinase
MSVKEEQTLVLIKPDALKVCLTGYIISQLSEYHTGLRLAGAKVVHVSELLAEEHYAEHKGKAFFPSLIDFITGKLHNPESPDQRKVIAFVYSGADAIKKIRAICGPTNPHTARDTAPGTIRSLGAVVPIKDASGSVIGDRMDNLIHASANPADAEREIKLWFKPNDISPYMREFETSVCDKHYYCKDGALFTEYQKGRFCLTAPGDTLWKSDLDALMLIEQGKPAGIELNAIAVKYMINENIG